MQKSRELVGQKFGMLTVVEDSGKREGNSILWRCKCDCGGEILAVRHRLASGLVQNCGCIPGKMRPRVSDLIGKRFGMLTVIGDSGERDGSCSILWRCKCDCGGEILVVRSQLESGNTESCGCVPKQRASTRQIEDLTGRKFGELTVLSQAERDARNHVRWLCRCSCGNEVTVLASELKRGHTRSCGCMRRGGIRHDRRDLTGQRFGRLTVICPAENKYEYAASTWHCRCDCGKELDVYSGSLLRGMTKSCGCWNYEQQAKMHEHMDLHYQNDTCLEILERSCADTGKNKAGFRGLYLTKTGKYRVMITFQKKIYYLGSYKTFGEAVQARLDAEDSLHVGYIKAFNAYEEKAKKNESWAEENPFFYIVQRINGKFQVQTNGA